MKKTLASLLASALVAAGMIAKTAPTAMAATDCDAVGDGATLTGDIVVRPGVGCELNDVTVKGSLLLGPGSHVYLTGTQISGSVRNTRGSPPA